jgi:hypothetical protein
MFYGPASGLPVQVSFSQGSQILVGNMLAGSGLLSFGQNSFYGLAHFPLLT